MNEGIKKILNSNPAHQFCWQKKRTSSNLLSSQNISFRKVDQHHRFFMPLLEKCYLLRLSKMEVDSSLDSSSSVKNAQVQVHPSFSETPKRNLPWLMTFTSQHKPPIEVNEKILTWLLWKAGYHLFIYFCKCSASWRLATVTEGGNVPGLCFVSLKDHLSFRSEEFATIRIPLNLP